MNFFKKMLYLQGKAFYIRLNMDIIFKNRKLEKIFNSSRLLDKEYGENADKIRKRMAVLKAAPSLAHVSHQKPERRHALSGDRIGEFAVDLRHPFRLIFKPDHDPVPCKEDGGIDLRRVTSITIIEVEDYHK